MPATIKIVNGKPVIVGTDSSADLQPSVPEENTKRKPRPPARRRRRLNPFQQLVNDVTYEFRQARRDPVRSLQRLAGNTVPTALRMATGLQTNPFGGGEALATGAGVADNALRMGYAAFQRMRGQKQADPSQGRFGQFLDRQVDMAYRIAGATPPSQQTATQRQADMMRRSLMLNGLLAGATGAAGAIRATTMAGRIIRGGTSFAANEAASQFLDDNTGGGFVDMVNAALGTKLPGGLGDRIGKADPIEAAQATFMGNVIGGQAVGATIGAAATLLPATARRLRQIRLKEEETKARGRLAQGGVIEDAGDGAYRPGPTVAEAAPQKPPAGFAEADAAMRQRLGQEPIPPPPEIPADLQRLMDENTARIAELNQENAAAVEGFAKPQPGALPDPLDPAIDPWDDFDPELPEVTDVLKTLDELSPEQIRQLDRADGPITEPVQRAQEEQAMTPAPQPIPFSRVAAPTERISQLYLEGAGEVEGWSSLLDAVDPVDLRALNDPEVSPELVQELVNQRGSWEDATANDIRDALRSLSQQGRTALVERLGRTQTMAVDEIATDPARFQYKEGVDAQGQQVGASLDGVEAWNPRAEGVIDVWRDPADGKVYVVNGHNRLALARRLGIPSVPVREITASKASAARAFGAIANIAEGQGNAFDAAKFMRESGLTTPEQLRAAGMTGERSWARDGLALSKLPDDLYRQAIDREGGMTLRKAVIIGESGLPESGMRMLAGEVRKNPNIPDWELKEIGTMTASSPAMKARQEGIPGMETYGVDEGARAKVRLVRQVEELLRKDAKTFGGVAKAAGRLEGKAANTIDRAGSKAVAEQSSTALDAFTRLKYQTGEVADRLNRATQQIADGEAPAAVARQVADEMPAILQREMDAAMGRTPAPEVNPDQVDLFAPPEETGPPVEPPPTAAELEGAKMRITARAIQNGEARPPTTPLPELSDPPRVRPDDAIADIHARQAVEPGTPGAQALEDEIRLASEQALEDSANRWEAEQQLREAYGYDELTFEEKKALGMIDGWDDPGPTPVAPAAAGELQAPARPQRLSLSQSDQPPFTLPDTLRRSAPRYGRFTVAFESDLDRAAYILQNDLKKPSKSAAAFRQAVEDAGLDPKTVARHGATVKAALKEAARGGSASEVRLPAQPWGKEQVRMVARATKAGDAAAAKVVDDAELHIDLVGKLVRLVGGPDAKLKLKKVYQYDIVPPEWGGDGIAVAQTNGHYDYIRDIIQVNGLLEGTTDELAETALHESFHRLQFMALTRKELEVLDSPEARRRVMMVAHAEGMDDISYLEAQTVAFQKYAIAKLHGKDPVAEIFKTAMDYDHPLTPVVARIISIFDKIANYVERVKNLARGKGFSSIQSIFDQAAKGSIARRQRSLLQPLGLSDNGDLYGKWVEGDTLGRPMDDILSEIASLDSQMEQIRQRAAKEGC